MPKHAFNAKEADAIEFKLLDDGDYPFEVIAVDVGIRPSGVTSGAEYVEMKCAFFADDTFSQKLAQFTEDLIFHKSTAWKIPVFTRCANMLVDGREPLDKEELDYSSDTMVGLRGWATVRNKPGQKDPQKRFNYVAVWLTNKPKLARNVPTQAEEATEEKNLPF